MRWNDDDGDKLLDAGVIACAEHSQWLTEALASGREYPRIPLRLVAWGGFSSWLRRPSVTTEISGLYAASPASPAGPDASQVVLSAALAAYGGDDYLRARIARR